MVDRFESEDGRQWIEIYPDSKIVYRSSERRKGEQKIESKLVMTTEEAVVITQAPVVTKWKTEDLYAGGMHYQKIRSLDNDELQALPAYAWWCRVKALALAVLTLVVTTGCIYFIWFISARGEHAVTIVWLPAFIFWVLGYTWARDCLDLATSSFTTHILKEVEVYGAGGEWLELLPGSPFAYRSSRRKPGKGKKAHLSLDPRQDSRASLLEEGEVVASDPIVTRALSEEELLELNRPPRMRRKLTTYTYAIWLAGAAWAIYAIMRDHAYALIPMAAFPPLFAWAEFAPRKRTPVESRGVTRYAVMVPSEGAEKTFWVEAFDLPDALERKRHTPLG